MFGSRDVSGPSWRVMENVPLNAIGICDALYSYRCSERHADCVLVENTASHSTIHSWKAGARITFRWKPQ